MAYTEFRKSYSDFEVVIPAVDFSSLTIDEALKAIRAFHEYQYGFVCSTLVTHKALEARGRIHEMLSVFSVNNLGSLIEDSFIKDTTIPCFGICRAPGDVLRKAWCNHMANEIEREFKL